MPIIFTRITSLKILLFLFLVIPKGVAQILPGDKIIGEWVNEENNDIIEIERNSDVYEGRIISGKGIFDEVGDSFKLDKNNPDSALRIRSLYNIMILSGFQYRESVWNNGVYYDYKSGKHYDTIIRLKNNTLEIRSYIGITLFGRSTYWHRPKTIIVNSK